MPSTTHNSHHNVTRYHVATDQSTNSRNVKHAKKSFRHHPLTPLSSEDWVLFERKVATSEVPSAKHVLHDRMIPSKDLTFGVSLPADHVIKSKAATPSTPLTREKTGNFKCLTHMSARNCRAECLSAKPPAVMKRPPPAPRPPRLPSPDLSDFEGDEAFPNLDSFGNEESKKSVLAWGSIDDDLGELYHYPR